MTTDTRKPTEPSPALVDQGDDAFRLSTTTLGRILVVLTAVVLISIWAIWASRTTALILPTPWDVVDRLVSFVTEGRIWTHLFVTAQEIVLGFLLGGAIGIGFGTLAAESVIARRVIMPYVIISQALPKFALAPILVIWFGFGITPKVIIAALIAFFPLLENTYLGLTTTPPEMKELFRAIRAPRRMTMLKLKVPHAIPAIFSGFRVALILSLVGAVVAEYVGANRGLGALIIVAQGTLDTELMFVAFVVLTALGFTLDKIHGLVYRLVLRRLYGRSVAAEATGTAARPSV